MKINLNRIHRTTLASLCALALGPAALFAGSVPKTAEARGIIKSVDTKTHQIVVTDKKTKAEGTFKWSDQTKFTEHGKNGSANALKAGVPAQISYAPSSGTPLLECVKLLPAKEQKHSSGSRFFHQKS